MNPKKRKAEDEGSSEEKQSTPENENETTDIHAATNSGSGESVNSSDQEKPDNGGASEQPGTSDEKESEKDSKETNDQTLDQPENKQIVSHHVLVFTIRF